jgi:hypothetical protein
MDALVGGLPRGAMTEICGVACSGRTSLLLSAVASRTADGEVCALVDARDSFDPLTGNAAGIELTKLLWVRCQNIEQALRATDLLIQAGGFGMVAVDLSDVPTRTVRQVPLNAWFRFRRAVEDTPTILLLLEQESNAKTCASLVVRLEAGEAQWAEASASCYPFAKLLRGLSVGADVLRSRLQTPTESRVVDIRMGAQPKIAAPLAGSAAESGIFQASANWSFRCRIRAPARCQRYLGCELV